MTDLFSRNKQIKGVVGSHQLMNILVMFLCVCTSMSHPCMREQDSFERHFAVKETTKRCKKTQKDAKRLLQHSNKTSKKTKKQNNDYINEKRGKLTFCHTVVSLLLLISDRSKLGRHTTHCVCKARWDFTALSLQKCITALRFLEFKNSCFSVQRTKGISSCVHK